MGGGTRFTADIAIRIAGVVIGVGGQPLDGFCFGFLTSCAGIGTNTVVFAGGFLGDCSTIPFVGSGSGFAADIAIRVAAVVIGMFARFLHGFFLGFRAITARKGFDTFFHAVGLLCDIAPIPGMVGLPLFSAYGAGAIADIAESMRPFGSFGGGRLIAQTAYEELASFGCAGWRFCYILLNLVTYAAIVASSVCKGLRVDRVYGDVGPLLLRSSV